MPKHTVVVAPVYPAQRVIRSVLVGIVVWGPTLVVIVPAVLDAAHGLSQAGVVPPQVYGQLAAIGAGALAVEGALARVIALPAVNRVLTKLGAGTVPRAAAQREAVSVVKGTEEALAAIEARPVSGGTQ